MLSSQQRSIFNRLKDLISPRRNKHILNEIGCSVDDIPDEYRCALSREIMDEPVMLDDNPQHIVNKSLLLQIWQDTNLNRINPFTGEPILHDPIPCDDLKKTIDTFVDAQVTYFGEMKKAIEALKDEFEYDTAPKSNLTIVAELKISPSLFPPACLETLLTDKLMTYPVKIDDDYTVDLRSLLSWWDENPASLYKNPHTCQFIKTIQVDATILNIINIFLTQYESSEKRLSDEAIETELKTIRERINRSDSKKTTRQCLLEGEVNLTNISSRDTQFLLGQNLSHDFITHPVTIDGTHHVDFATLMSWWSEAPANRYLNFYTGQRIKSIEYDDYLKEKIDSVVYGLIHPIKNHGLAMLLRPTPLQFGIFHRQGRTELGAAEFAAVTLAQMRRFGNQSS